MKNPLRSTLFCLFLAVAALLVPRTESTAQPGYNINYQTFYDALSPYGDWIYDPSYGYVWAPQVYDDFRPYYSAGRWVMTDFGNTWVSDYDWGWAPFHYGRWTYSPYYGWLWIPGTTWGPAWVSWRYGGGNFGWAPLGPGVGINIQIGNWYAPNDWWCFTPQSYLYRGGYQNYWQGPTYNTTYINQTTIVNNTTVINNNTYVYGPRREMVERATGERVVVRQISNQKSPERSVVRQNSVNMYRPEVARTVPAHATTLAPRSFTRADRGVFAATAENESFRTRRLSAAPTEIPGTTSRPFTGDAPEKRNPNAPPARTLPNSPNAAQDTRALIERNPADRYDLRQPSMDRSNRFDGRAAERTNDFSPRNTETAQPAREAWDRATPTNPLRTPNPVQRPNYRAPDRTPAPSEPMFPDRPGRQQFAHEPRPNRADPIERNTQQPVRTPAPNYYQQQNPSPDRNVQPQRLAAPQYDRMATPPPTMDNRNWRRPEPQPVQPRPMSEERVMPSQRFEQTAPQRFAPSIQQNTPVNVQPRFERPQPAPRPSGRERTERFERR